MSRQDLFANYDDESIRAGLDYLVNRSVSDARHFGGSRRAGAQYDGERQLFDALGYPEPGDITAEQFRNLARRTDIAHRIVTKPAKDTWRHPPDIVDDEEADDHTPFEEAVDHLADESRLFHYCRRADWVSGYGEYGLLFLGVADGATDLSQPIEAGQLNGPDDLAYLTPFAEYQVDDWTLGKDAGLDPTDERYTLPVQYRIDFADPDVRESDLHDVHHSRLIHIAEGTAESDLKGTPRLRPVYNRFMDYQKVLGSSGEMFYRGADRKFHFDVRDGYADLDPDDLEQLDEDAQNFIHDLQNYIKTAGIDLNVIGGDDPNPAPTLDEIQKAIAGATGIPKRILTGSEQAELASTQDRANWYGQVEERQHNFAEPKILRPLLDRLIDIGVLPPPEATDDPGPDYTISWPNLFELNELEQANVQQARGDTLQKVIDVEAAMTPDEQTTYLEDGEFPDDLDEREEEEDDAQDELGALDDGFDADIPGEGDDVVELPDDVESPEDAEDGEDEASDQPPGEAASADD